MVVYHHWPLRLIPDMVYATLNQRSASEILLSPWSISSFLAREDNVSKICDCSCLLCLGKFLAASIDWH